MKIILLWIEPFLGLLVYEEKEVDDYDYEEKEVELRFQTKNLLKWKGWIKGDGIYNNKTQTLQNSICLFGGKTSSSLPDRPAPPPPPLHPNLLKQKQLGKRINDDKQKGGWKSENEWRSARRSACGGKCSNP